MLLIGITKGSVVAVAQSENFNRIALEGTIVSEINFSHQLFDERFYVFTLSVLRRSDYSDDVQVTVSDKLLADLSLRNGMKISVEGQLRSYNKQEGNRNRLILMVFARSILRAFGQTKDPNQIQLEGYICKQPIYRKTPFGREITDLLVAVNRAYKKSDYIPVIAWGRNARTAKHLMVGDKIRLEGRFQSRAYQKCFGPNQTEVCTAYEVSVNRLERLDKKETEGAEVDCDEGLSSLA